MSGASRSRWFTLSPAPVDKGRRTLRWRVTTLDGAPLGFVEWYAPWRCYTFNSTTDSAYFDKACLRDLADFCERSTVDHMAKVKAARQAAQATGRSHP